MIRTSIGLVVAAFLLTAPAVHAAGGSQEAAEAKAAGSAGKPDTPAAPPPRPKTPGGGDCGPPSPSAHRRERRPTHDHGWLLADRPARDHGCCRLHHVGLRASPGRRSRYVAYARRRLLHRRAGRPHAYAGRAPER